jgi:hypothetical protein
MPVSSLGSGIPGANTRLFPWQVDHYIVRGGPNDPVLQTGPATPAAQTGGGSLSWNSTITLPPVPGQQPATNRTMVLNSTGSLASGQLGTNTGGIYIGTLPQGSWIQNFQLFCYQALAGGTSTSVGLFWTAESTDVGYPPATLNLIAYITSPAANTNYSVVTASGVTAFTAVNGTVGPLGPGNAVTAGGIASLASLTDIDLYVAAFLIAGAGTANTAGTYAAMVNFTGLEG